MYSMLTIVYNTVLYVWKLLREIFFFLAVPRSMWDLSSPTRDRTRAPCSGSAESQPLDCQGIPEGKS